MFFRKKSFGNTQVTLNVISINVCNQNNRQISHFCFTGFTGGGNTAKYAKWKAESLKQAYFACETKRGKKGSISHAKRAKLKRKSLKQGIFRMSQILHAKYAK